MATITVDQYNDDGTTSRTAGEVLTINGAVFTQRTDTRWHATAPGSMTGTFGGACVISSSLGGGFKIDGTNVRWIPFTSGTGNVPSIGTTITGGTSGASGYLLAVYANLTSAPSTVGGVMPASGFLKFREVTSGPFNSSESLTGIGASTNGPEVAGWLEIVMDQAGNWSIPRLGLFQVRGDWFYLDNTTGVRGQTLQVPTNGGGANTFCPGVWIAEAPVTITGATWANGVATYTATAHGFKNKQVILIEGISPAGYNLEAEITVINANTFTIPIASNPGSYSSGGTATWFDFYPGLRTTTQWGTASLGTDARSKFVETIGSGQLRIGSDGTNDIGYLPASGRRTRVPNVFLRQCTTAARATNAAPNATLATRPDFTTTTAGYMDIEYAYGDWYFYFLQAYYTKLHHFATFETVYIAECATALDLNNGFTGMYSALDTYSLRLTSCFAGGEIRNWGGPRGNAAGSSDHDVYIEYCIGQVFTNVRGGILAYARSSGHPIYATQSSNLIFNNCRATNGPLTLNTCSDCEVNNKDHVDRYVGTTTTATGYAFQVQASCANIKINGLSFGLDGLIANVHPYTALVYLQASSGVKVRNFGSRSSFLSGGSANNPGYIFASGGNNVDVKIQRCYLAPTRTGAISTLNSDKGMIYEHVYGDMGDTMTLASLNSVVKNGGGTNTVTGQSSVYGTHFWDAFTSNTVGRVILSCNEPTVETQSLVTTSFGVGSGFTSVGGVTMVNVNDYLIVEMNYFVKGCTSFQNAAATLTGTNTGNHSFEYQIDVNNGNGWNGTWKTLNGANLSGESISPSLGFKLKYRITCITAAATNLVTYVRILTNSTLAAQTDNLYDLDPVPLVITVLDAVSKSPISGARVFLETYPGGTDLLNALTDADGQASVMYGYLADQALVGRARKASSAPLYRTGDIIGTITEEGFAQTVLLIGDE